jgi:hypothetical protein
MPAAAAWRRGWLPAHATAARYRRTAATAASMSWAPGEFPVLVSRHGPAARLQGAPEGRGTVIQGNEGK